MQFSINNQLIDPFRIFCIGKNYDEHIKELGGKERPSEPVVFMKHISSIVPPGDLIFYPRFGSELHHEAEIVLLIGKEGKDIAEDDAYSYIAGVTLGLDLTLRDVQGKLKKKGLPWELSKSFEQSAPLGHFKAFDPDSMDLNNLSFSCRVNGDLRQNGSASDMIFPIKSLIVALSSWWTLRSGDIIFTGTPSGVGPLKVGDEIEIQNLDIGLFSWKIINS